MDTYNDPLEVLCFFVYTFYKDVSVSLNWERLEPGEAGADGTLLKHKIMVNICLFLCQICIRLSSKMSLIPSNEATLKNKKRTVLMLVPRVNESTMLNTKVLSTNEAGAQSLVISLSIAQTLLTDKQRELLIDETIANNETALMSTTDDVSIVQRHPFAHEFKGF